MTAGNNGTTKPSFPGKVMRIFLRKGNKKWMMLSCVGTFILLMNIVLYVYN